MTLFVGNSTVNSSVDTTTASIGANSSTTALFVAANGNVGVGNTVPTSKLSVNGTTYFQANVTLNSGLIANGSIGTAGHVLHSNGTATYWAPDDTGGGTITSISTGNGLTGGPIASSGTISALANTGIVANATGLYVNASYIATIASNSANYANGSISNTFTVGTGTYFVSNGNVGINTNTPTFKLDMVAGNLANTAGSQIQLQRFYSYDGNADYLEITNTRMLANTTWNGAGSRLQQKVDATWHGFIQFNGGTGSDYNSQGIIFGTGGSSVSATSVPEVMRITSGGNVGIGASNPSQKLHVSGIGYATTDFRAPFFYDSDNTGYYVNAADWSKLAGLWTDWGTIVFQSTQHKRITSNDGGGNWNFRAGNYMNGTLQYINNGANSGAATITLNVDGGDGIIYFYTAPVGVAGANVSYTGTAYFDRYGTFYASGDLRSPRYYDSDNTAYYIDGAGSSVLTRLSLFSGTTSAVHVNDVAGNASFNFIMSAANDTGTKLVAFVNGSNRSADGGNNAVVIRNDGGPFVLGSASYATTVQGSSVTVPNDLIVSGGVDAIQFNNATSNYMLWNSAGTAAPAFTTRSAGTKLVLFPQINATNVDYALGIETNTLWSSVPTTSQQFKWYGGTTLAMTLSGAGQLTLVNNQIVNLASTSLATFATAATASEGQLIANFSGQNSAYLYNNSTYWGLYSASGGGLIVYNRSLARGELNAPYTAVTGSIRAPIFYDSDNVSYYMSPASTSVFNEIYSSQYRILNSGVFIWQHDSAGANNKFWDTYSGSDGTLNFRTVNDTYTASVNWLTVTRSGNSPQVITLGGTYTTAAGSLRAPIFYDSDDTAFYANLAGSSYLNDLSVSSNFYIRRQNATTEGGEFRIQIANNSGLSGDITIDSVGNGIRIFEGGGTARGIILDLSACAAGAASVLLHSANYNSYAPTLTGTGASGTWNITANNATNFGGLSTISYVQRYAIPNTGAATGWVNLGTFACSQDGDVLKIKIYATTGYNADITQNQITEIFFKTSNGTSNTAGFLGDAYAHTFGPQTNSPTTIRIVQSSSTSYVVHANFGTYSGTSFYEIAHGGTSWTHSGTNNGATAPTGTYIDVTKYKIWTELSDGAGSGLDADLLDGQHATYYTNATNITTGTLPYAQIPANVINTTAAFTRSGITTFSANVVMGSSGLSSNGSFGTAGQVLHSNGTATYWAADDVGVTSVATSSGLTGGTINSTGTISVLANNGITANATGLYVTQGTGTVVNATGVHVNSTYIGTISANNTTYFDGDSSTTFASALRANRNLNGGGTITVDASYNVYWSARFIVISNSRGTNFSTSGYFDITCPTSGTITGVGGAANVTATAAGIPLGAWVALYYILPIGSNEPTVAANFRVATFTSNLDIPAEWLLIAVRNGDDGMVYFNNGMRLSASKTEDSNKVSGNVVAAAALTGGISALTFDKYGRITAATGSASYATTTQLASYLPLAGGTMTGLLIGQKPTTSGISAGNDGGSASFRGNTTTSAHVSFHRESAYAVNMGLDTDNVFRIGGWSDGAATYRVQFGTPGGTHTFNGTVSATTFSGAGTNLTGTASNLTAGATTQSGSKTLLNTLTASSSASLSDTTNFTSTYEWYEIVFENLLNATNATTVYIQLHSGAAFQNANYYHMNWLYNAGGTAAASSTTATYIPLGQVGFMGNTLAGHSGFLRIFRPSDTTTKKYVVGQIYGPSSAATHVGTQVNGFWNGGNGAITGFQVLAASGNLTSGVIKIYGVRA